ncbi:hypothetical protein B0A49_02118 [Cryomyces minteri]|uniref:RTA1 domain protein n=1 Tax=Cryomyces minteri TaxID=331657 RepID=A0A4U0XJG3_9PEZI|nr:hypothetical protein B0A49_02118 [Cryomyces minteri]
METGRYGSLWFYAPDKVAPIVFATLFFASALLHMYQCMHYKSWKFTGLAAAATLIFVAGYILRAYGAYHYDDIGIYIASVVCLYSAPPIYELANYFVLGRILYYVPYHSPLHPGRVLTTFSAISAIVEVLNGQGASRVANTHSPPHYQDVGHGLLKAALLLQLAIIGVFVVLAGYFHRRCKKGGVLKRNLKAVLLTLYGSCALITVRTIYRTVEYFQVASIDLASGSTHSRISPVVRYEWFFWVFEAVPMLSNTFLLNARHPAMCLPQNTKMYLSDDGVSEVEGPGYEDKRPFWVTFVDPFDLVGLVKGRDGKEKYWERRDGGG